MSLSLLRLLYDQKGLALLIIGAYRINEVDDRHLMVIWRNEMTEAARAEIAHDAATKATVGTRAGAAAAAVTASAAVGPKTVASPRHSPSSMSSRSIAARWASDPLGETGIWAFADSGAASRTAARIKRARTDTGSAFMTRCFAL